MNIVKQITVLGMSALLVGAAAGCSSSTSADGAPSTEGSASASTESTPTKAPVTVKDGAPEYCGTLSALLSDTSATDQSEYVKSLSTVSEQATAAQAPAIAAAIKSFGDYLAYAETVTANATPTKKQEKDLTEKGEAVRLELQNVTPQIVEQCGFDPNTVTAG